LKAPYYGAILGSKGGQTVASIEDYPKFQKFLINMTISNFILFFKVAGLHINKLKEETIPYLQLMFNTN